MRVNEKQERGKGKREGGGDQKIFQYWLSSSPAGGCLLSMCCDYRVMVGPKYTIGLNETQLGIVAPFWFKEGFQAKKKNVYDFYCEQKSF